jgi:hypothetical protein
METRPAALHCSANLRKISPHGGHRERFRTGSTVLVNDYSYLGKSEEVSLALGEKWQTSFMKGPYRRQLCPSLSSMLRYQPLARSGKHLY